MTRPAIGGIAAGAFVLGILAGVVIPGAVARFDGDPHLLGSMARAHGMPGMHAMSSTGSIPTSGDIGGWMPMHQTMAGSDHAGHHASQGTMP